MECQNCLCEANYFLHLTEGKKEKKKKKGKDL